MPQAAAIAAIVGAAASAASTGYALSKGSPSVPKAPPPPAPPPPAPPPAAAAPPPAIETAAEQPQAQAKRKRALSYGVEQTLLTSPLGSPNPGATGGKTLIGG